MRIIGLDVGEKRIGVARADSSTRIAVPVGFIEVDGSEWQEIARLASRYSTNYFVLGLPRSNEGNETSQSLYTRNFAKTLAEKIPGAKIRFQDESLTSIEAEERLIARGKPYKKGEIDAEAASIILQDFLENMAAGGNGQTIDAAMAETTPDEVTSTGIMAGAMDAISATKDNVANLTKKEADKVKLNTKKAKHRLGKILGLIVLPIIGVLVVGAVVGLIWWNNMLAPVTPDCEEAGCEEVHFTVTEGESKSVIADNLEEAGLIKSAFVFKAYQGLFKSEADFKSGAYTFNKGLTVEEIIDLLAKGATDNNTFSFTILPGENIFEVRNKLIETGYSEAEVDEALAAKYDFDFLANRPADATLEGYLYGETHEFYTDATVKEILEQFLTDMSKVITENNLEERYAAHGLSLYEGITLASIVQKEAPSEEQPTVAQVFLTRLDNGIMLGSDVTVSYALEKVDPGRHTYTDNSAALEVESCYNTRRKAGLPCGPISNPGLSALLAVAEPSQTSYLYFLTGDDGLMYYSYTEAEHNQNIYSHCRDLCNISL